MKKLLATKLLALSLILASSYGYAIDATKLETELGWRAEQDFDSGLNVTIDWYLDNRWWWEPIRDGRYAGERLGRGVAGTERRNLKTGT